MVQTAGESATLSPYPYPPTLDGVYGTAAGWDEVLQHMAQRLEWADAGLTMDVFEVREVDSPAFQAAAAAADLFLFVGVRDPSVIPALSAATMIIPTGVALDCAGTTSVKSSYELYERCVFRQGLGHTPIIVAA